MERSIPPTFNASIYQQACEWFVEFRTGEPPEAARNAFHAWLQESPQHMRAYLQVTALWNESDAVVRDEKWTFDALIAEAAADPGNLVPIEGLLRPSHTEWCAVGDQELAQNEALFSFRVRLQRFKSGSLLAASVLLTVVGISTWHVTQRDTYFTAIGEQRSITLPDGSTVNLNSRSRIRVRYSAQERAVELREGQAFFEVAKSPNRPFIVTSDKTRVRAVGTRFDVYQKANGTVVTVIEGRVAVLPLAAREGNGEGGEAPEKDAPSSAMGELRSPVGTKSAGERSVRSARAGRRMGEEDLRGADSPLRVRTVESSVRESPGGLHNGSERVSDEVFLSAGQQLRVASNTVSRPILTDIARAIAWTQRQLVFDSTPLSEVAEEFNRYNARKLVIENPALNTFQIDGVFASTDPASLIRFLRERADIQVTETRAEIVITRK